MEYRSSFDWSSWLLQSSLTLAVDCISDGGSLRVEAVVLDWWGAPIIIFSVFLFFQSSALLSLALLLPLALLLFAEL